MRPGHPASTKGQRPQNAVVESASTPSGYLVIAQPDDGWASGVLRCIKT